MVGLWVVGRVLHWLLETQADCFAFRDRAIWGKLASVVLICEIE